MRPGRAAAWQNAIAEPGAFWLAWVSAVGVEVVEVDVVGVEMSDARLRPDAVITLGEWEVVETGERVEVACVMMRRPELATGPTEAVDLMRRELPARVQELVTWVLEIWREERLSRS